MQPERYLAISMTAASPKEIPGGKDACLVDCADVRVVQGRGGFSFPLETAESLRIACKFVGQELQGDVATKLGVFRLVHHPHSSATDPA
jgi:hypothetical protein